MRRLVFLALTLATACSDALEQSTTAGQVVAVASVDGSVLSLISASDFTSSDVNLPFSARSPRLVGGGSVVLLTSDSSGRVAVVDLHARPFAVTGSFVATAPGGAAIQDDSIAWIPLALDNLLERLNYRTGTSATTPVSLLPRAVALTAGKVFVLNTNRASSPDPSSYLRVVDPTTRTLEDSIPLSGTGARFMTLGGDSLLYVVDGGVFGGDGKLSIVDPRARKEIVVINGLGDGAGPAVFHPSGRLLIASATKGILEVNTLTRALTRGPDDPITDAGDVITGLAIDERRRVYAMDPVGCVVHVLEPPPDYHPSRTVTVGGCPSSAAAATVP